MNDDSADDDDDLGAVIDGTTTNDSREDYSSISESGWRPAVSFRSTGSDSDGDHNYEIENASDLEELEETRPSSSDVLFTATTVQDAILRYNDPFVSVIRKQRTINGKHAGLILLTFQNEFVHEGGKLHHNVKDMLLKTSMVEKTSNLIEKARECGITIIFSPVIGKTTDIVFAHGTWGCEFAAEMMPRSNDIVLGSRKTFNAFNGTGLGAVIAEKNIGVLLIGGFLTSLNVSETTITAVEDYGLEVYTLTDGCADRSERDHLTCIKSIFPMYSKPISCAQACQLLENDEGGYQLTSRSSTTSSSILDPISTASILVPFGVSYSTLISREAKVAHFIDNVVFQNSTDGLTKTEFELLLIKGFRSFYVKKEVQDDIFNSCDTSGDGRISREELTEYVCKNEKQARSNREIAKLTFWKIVKTISTYLNLCFISACVLSLSANIISRGSRNVDDVFVNIDIYVVVAWLYLVGMSVYAYNSYESQKNNFELKELGLRMMYDWVTTSDLFRPLTKQISRQCIVTTSDDEVNNEMLQRFISNEGLGLGDIQNVLEHFSVYLPLLILQSIFEDIDIDKSGVVTKDNIKDFVSEYKMRKLTTFRKYWEILKNSFRAWDFWANFTWLIGSICFAIMAHLPSHIKEETPNVPLHLNGLGSILYLAGGLSGLPQIYTETERLLENFNDLRKAVIQVLSELIADKSITSKRRFLGEMSFTKKSILRASVARQTTNVLKSAYRISTVTFGGKKKTRPRNDGSSLDRFELYNVLLDKGVLTPFEVFTEVFQQMDIDNDGRIQLEDFANGISEFDTYSSSTTKRRLDVLKILPTLASFWVTVLYIVAGILYVIQAYVFHVFPQVETIFSNLPSNCSLVASFCYLFPTCRSLTLACISCWSHQKLLDSSILKFANEIIRRSEEYTKASIIRQSTELPN